ncbi:MAG TPA: helix-turn-helix domain-containing protein [Candidatus Polarisedimenticolia bacterium]|nr:helix-turn-helix domain-containing protein [Candidatus Polarisedimenticolia bacterium]
MAPGHPSTPHSLFRSARFSDHDELTSLIQGGDAEFIQKGRGAFEGNFTFVGLDGGTLQFGHIKLPHIGRGASSVKRLGFLLRLDLRGDWIWSGKNMDPRSIFYLAPHAEHQDICPGDSSWAFLSFERYLIDRASSEILGSTDASLPSRGSRLFLPDSEPFELLRRRLKAMQAAVHTDPSLLEVPEARHGMRESILAALSAALGSSSRVRPLNESVAARRRVSRQVDAYLDASRGETIYLSDLCAVTGVSERTLRTVFQENYRMSPVRYLRLRRLHQVRRTLRRVDAEGNTVQSVANRYGIWHLGRFAADYRYLFGESPVDTLRGARGAEAPAKGAWPGVAASGRLLPET